jgi:nitrogen fixation/metabolism regulation signal transduction histidine kinase
MLCGVALVLTTGLSVVVFRNADAARVQATSAVTQAERAFRESKTSAEVLHTNAMMNAGDNPELVAQINGDLRRAEAELTSKLDEAHRSREAIERNYRMTRYTLLFGGALLVFLLGLSGIVITHKLVGPVFKLKRLLRAVGSGKLDIHERLRKGDELEDLFEVFLGMVDSLRSTQAAEIAQLEAAIADAKTSGVASSTVDKLTTLLERMKATLGSDASP